MRSPKAGPDWKHELELRLADLPGDRYRLDDIVEELAQHLDDRYRQLVESGVPDDDAHRDALNELAAPDVLARALRPVARAPVFVPAVPGAPWRGGWLAGWGHDVRDGLRSLRNTPGLTTVALLTLSIVIGANAAIFSVVNAAILRPLPFAQPERLVSFWGSAPQMGLPVVRYPDALYVYFRNRARTLTPIAAYGAFSATITGGVAEPLRVDGAGVTADFFEVLGRAPAHGRAFLAEEEARGRNHVMVLGYGFWQRRFGASLDVIGRLLTVNGVPKTVIGVMPEGFDFPNRAELWVPLPTDPQSQNCWCFSTIGRLAPGQTPAAAAREIAWLHDDFQLEREGKPVQGPQVGSDPSAIVIAQPLARELVGDVRNSLLVLLGAVGMVLLIACANIANLLLARANARSREMALRCSLGASPWRIARQLLVESLLLGLAGAALGLAFAWWGARALGRLVIEQLSYVQAVTPDTTVLLFTITVTLVTVVLFGVAPAIRGARVDLQEAVKDGWRTTRGTGGRRLTNSFVVVQFALSIVLLAGAALLLRSLGNLRAVDPGFRSDNVLVGRVSLPLANRPADTRDGHARTFYAQLADRLSAMPGVAKVGLSSMAPFSNGNNQGIFMIRGREPAPGQPRLVASTREVTPGYFAAVGTPLRRGRLFDASDTDQSPLVVVVDETLAHRFWPDGNAVGHDLRLDEDGPWRRIVGVVASVKHGDLSLESDRYVYIPHAQRPAGQMDVVVRTNLEPAAMAAAIRYELLRMDPTLPLYEVHTLDQAMAASLLTRRLTNNLLLAFALTALILAAIGIYGVMSLGVGQRVHEFGIRLALGAKPRDVLALVLGQGMRLVGVGALLGLAGAASLTRHLGALLFGVEPLDPLTFASVTVLLVIVALAACLVPARRATATPPIEALRQG